MRVDVYRFIAAEQDDPICYYEVNYHTTVNTFEFIRKHISYSDYWMDMITSFTRQLCGQTMAGQNYTWNFSTTKKKETNCRI